MAQDTILTGHHKFGLVIHHFCESIIFNFDVALKFMLSLTPANFFLSNAFLIDKYTVHGLGFTIRFCL